MDRLGNGNHIGITATSGGFYGPQGRQLRAVPSVDTLNDSFTSFRYPGKAEGEELRITNYEMETSALYRSADCSGTAPLPSAPWWPTACARSTARTTMRPSRR